MAGVSDTAAPRSAEPPAHRSGRVLVVVGIVALAFNLRPVAVSVGPVLDELTRALSMSATTAGVLTTLPVLAFAVVGAVAPWIGRLVGVHRVTLAALLAVVAGVAVRSSTSSVPVFLLLSLLALAGMATANVLLPSLVKLHFPDRIGLMTAIYTTSLAVGLTGASVLTVPVAHAFGSWRWGLLVWALTAAVAAAPWLALGRHDTRLAPGLVSAGHRITLVAVARTRLGWAMAAFFGLQSLQAYSVFGWFAQIYRAAGFSARTAGFLLGVITALSIPLSLWLPTLTARLTRQHWLIGGLVACYPVGYLGLIFAPRRGAWLWAVMVGIGITTFPVVLTLIGLRTRTSEGTAALSGFTQSVGYLMAAVGPLGMGALYAATGGWTVPLAALVAVCVPLFVTGMLVSRPVYLEDALGDRGRLGAGGSPPARNLGG
jgi:CP family cyanate transporter-like MFS transporter